jgi:2-polyprenyl-6-methoxyphenol hydroxylase-like FAD-dependent oxidoreductase
MRGGRIAVVGGSVTGCAAALAAGRCGADEVIVFERTGGELEDRGMGLGVNDDRYAELTAAGFLDAEIPWVRLDRRRWFADDGSAAFGRELAAQPFPFRAYNWGSLWRELRARIPAAVRYHTGAAVVSVADSARGASIRLADGSIEHFDLVIGADGYRSVVRAAVFPDAAPQYAGYLLWRGTFPAEQLASLDHLVGGGADGPEGADGADRAAWGPSEAVTIGLSGSSGGSTGHLMSYRVPGASGELVNWVLYATPPAEIPVDADSPTSLPPGKVTQALVDHLGAMAETQLPAYWGSMVRLTRPEDLYVQPVFDLEVPRYVGSRLLLAGDAAAVARPHSGGGAVKALQDTAVLESIWREAGSWEELLRRYDDARRPVGQAMVAMGRQVGNAQVTAAPDWAEYDQAGFDEWWREISGAAPLGGRELKRP